MANERKTIFITGAASGMGRETARLFARRGWFVGAFDVNVDALDRLRGELGADTCLARRLDVTDKSDYDSAVREFGEATGGRMDLLFNNAGIGESGWFEDVPYDRARRVIEVNYIGVVNGIYAALPLLRATPHSLCFTTSSSSATYGMPRIAIYASTKFAVKGLTEALSVELDRFGIRVADVLPGLIDTAILDETPNRSGDTPDERDIRENAPKRGMFRLMPAESVAECVWAAYHSSSGRLHWYVPPEIEWIDRLKPWFPKLIRKKIRDFLMNTLARMDER